MRRATRSAAVTAVFAAAMMGSSVISGFSQAALAAPANPAFHGREVFKIVTVRLGERRPAARAWGAFRARGTFDRATATFDFPRGRITVRRQVTSTSFSGPNLATCQFSIFQHGTFTVIRGTGRFRGLRESGTFHTTLHGQYNRTGPDRCGYKLVAYHVVTYETGYAS